MAKFKYFELDEFIKSSTAIEKGIDNTPTFEVVDHLSELVSEILDPLRAAYGKPIYVSSGFRCLALNSILKGASTTSVHPIGYAADLYGGLQGFRERMADQDTNQIRPMYPGALRKG